MASKPTKTIVPVVQNSAENLIAQAIEKGVDVGTMERLLAMRTQIKAEQAKEAFNRAMAAFQADCPTIRKTKAVSTRSGGTAYMYAPIESIVAQVKPLLQKNGFSYTTQIDLTDKGVRATCKVTHEVGHSEESSMEVPLGNKTQVMSDSQVTAAASTFAKRYAFCNAFGILTGDEDNDGADFDTSPVSSKTVPTVTYDNPEDISLTPWKKPTAPTSDLKKKALIKDMIDKMVLAPLAQTAEAYEMYVEENFGMALAPENYDLIINGLTKKSYGEI